MPLRKPIEDREYDKFKEDLDGKTAVRTSGETLLMDEDGNVGQFIDFQGKKVFMVKDREADNRLKGIEDLLHQINEKLAIIIE